MSKMADMAQTIEDLHKAAAAIYDAADWLAQQFSETDEDLSANPASVQKPAKKELKLEDVRSVLADKSRAGYTAEIRDLLKKYGADKLSKVNPADYEALLKDAEVLGNGS
jgi:hypothetical protein